MAPKPKSGSSKATKNRSSKPSSSASSSRSKKSSSGKTTSTQHKPTPRNIILKAGKKKPPHLRYPESSLNLPALNGIRPAGVSKLPNKKKGKKFVDDGEGMRTIMAMVMAEKEGDVESKMMRARQLEEVREARRVEMEKRAESKKQGLEGRKQDIRQSKKKRRGGDAKLVSRVDEDVPPSEGTRQKKRVSFG